MTNQKRPFKNVLRYFSSTLLLYIYILCGVDVQVGGIKEKVLAAHRAGIGHVILPHRNEKDLKELPSGVKVRKIVLMNPRLFVRHMHSI